MLRAERSSYHYRGRRADQADLKKRVKEIAETRVRYGYRRIHVLLRREGWVVNAKRIYRLYREMGSVAYVERPGLQGMRRVNRRRTVQSYVRPMSAVWTAGHDEIRNVDRLDQTDALEGALQRTV